MNNYIKAFRACLIGIFLLSGCASDRTGSGTDYRRFVLDTVFMAELPAGSDEPTQAFFPYAFTPLPAGSVNEQKRFVFRLPFTIPLHLQSEELCLFLPASVYPFDLFLNGEKIYKTGLYNGKYTSTEYYGKMVYLPDALLKRKGGNLIEIRVVTMGERRTLPRLSIGTYKKISTGVFRYTLIRYTILAVFCGLSLFYFLIFFMLWFTGRYRTKTYLYFSFICLSLSFAYLNMVFCYPEVSELLLWKISRVAFCFAAAFLLMFAIEFTGVLERRIIVTVPLGVALTIFSWLIIIQSSKAGLFEVFTNASNVILLPVLIAVPLILGVSLFRQPKVGTFIVFLSIIVVIAASMHDLHYRNLLENPYVWYLPFGYMVMEFSIAIILALEQATMTKQIASQARELSGNYKELVAAKEAVDLASRAKSSFLSNMAHEFRTPLNWIDGSVQLLFESCQDSETRAHIEGVSSAAKRLAAVINDVLDYSSLESGKMELDISNFDLRETVTELVSFLQNEFQVKGIEFTFDYDPEMPVTFSGDQMRLSRVLRNLLENSLKFTRKGRVGIAISYMDEGGQSMVCIEVSDTGIGIPKERLAAIFSAFGQVEEGTFTRYYEGVGLGLSITARIVYLMGGDIGVESTEGEGTVFTLMLPLPKVTFGKTFRRISLAGLKVLVVEDNPVNVQIMSRFLEKLDIFYDIALNGQIGVEMYQRGDYDAILMDIQMPVMNGLDATRRIRELERGQVERIPIIAVTANADKKECIDAGMDGYLAKPVRKDLVKNELIRYCLSENA